MSSNGEFSTMSSGEVSSSLPKSLPSSREATAEANSNSAGGYMPLRDFLDRFSLPRVVRLEGSAGRPVLLYKQQQRSLRVTATLLIHRYRHDVKVGPEIVIPEGYPGWFSVISGNGATGGARVYRRVESLVRAGVPAFLLAAPLRAYILTHSKMENGNLRAHYTKTTIRAGEVLRLVAIFQDTRRCSSVSFNITGSSSDRDQYAQCLDPHGREVFAPLSARGEFYAVCQTEGSSSSSSGNGGIDTGSDAILYKVHHLARRQLPLRVRLIAGPLPVPLPREYGGLMQLESSTRGPIVLGCLVPETPVYNPEMLELLVSGNGAPRVRRARLGYPSEARLLASPKMQRLLTACSRAVGDRATEPRVAPQKFHSEDENLKEMHLKKIKPKPETKPILQSLREGLEHLTKPSSNSIAVPPGSGPSGNSQQQQQNPNRSSNSSTSGGSTSTSSSGPGGFLERISKLRQANRSRNPAKKSASFTFAVRPEIAMKAAAQKYSSLEPGESSNQGEGTSGSGASSSKQPVQRSVSTSVLEVTPAETIQLQPDYSRVRDSLSPQLPQLPPPPPPIETVKPDEIYAEICEIPPPVQRRPPSPVKCPGSHVMARIKILVKDDYRNNKPYGQEQIFDSKKLDRKYVNSIFVSSGHSHKGEPEDEIIYNTVF